MVNGRNKYRIKDIFDLSAGGDVDKEHFSAYKTSEHRYPIYSNSLENHGLYGYTSNPKYSADSVTITGRGSVGHAEYREDEFDAIIRLLVLKPKSSNVCAQFVADYINNCVDFSLESTGVPQLTAPQIMNVELELPQYDEQKEVTTVLADVSSLIDMLGKQISKKKAIKQGTMQELLTGNRRLPGFSGEWETKTLHEISNEMVDGPFGSNLKTEHYTTERQVRIIQLSNIGEAGWNNANVKYTTFSHAAELQRCIVQPGSILIAKMMPAGRAIICPDNEKSYILGSDVVKVVPNSSVDSRYLVYATKSRFYLDQIADDTQGSTRARTSVSKLRKTAILFPEKDEQIAIADILSEMDMEIAALEGKIAKYRQVKQGMMQQLLTGKIRLV